MTEAIWPYLPNHEAPTPLESSVFYDQRAHLLAAINALEDAKSHLSYDDEIGDMLRALQSMLRLRLVRVGK